MGATKESQKQSDRLTRFEMRRRERLRKKKLRRNITAAVVLTVLALGISAAGIHAALTKNADLAYKPTQTAAPTSEPTPEPKLLIPSPEEETDLINIIAHAGMKKRCYLTFDDGPSKQVTPQILDILARYNAKATFFEVGKYIDANPDMARRVHDEGHLIAGHSYSHDYNYLYANEDNFRAEVEKCYDKIREVTGEEELFKLIRFPGGSYNAGDHAAAKQEYKRTLADMGFYYCDWNCLNGDADGKSRSAEGLVEYFKTTSTGYNNLIVLMHDTDAKQKTADALPAIMDYLKEQGYEFYRLDEIDYNPTVTAAPQA